MTVSDMRFESQCHLFTLGRNVLLSSYFCLQNLKASLEITTSPLMRRKALFWGSQGVRADKPRVGSLVKPQRLLCFKVVTLIDQFSQEGLSYITVRHSY